MTKKDSSTLRGDKGDAIDAIGGEQQAMDNMIKRLEEGGHGYVPENKPE